MNIRDPRILADRHLYEIDGADLDRRWPYAVGDVIRDVLGGPDYDGVPHHVLERARERGTNVHAMLAKLAGVEEDHDRFDSEAREIAERVRALLEAEKIELHDAEVPLWWERGNVCGQCDLWATVDRRWTVIDLKVTAKLDTERVALQTAAYAWMIYDLSRRNGDHVQQTPDRAVIHAPKDGDPILVPLTRADDLEDFQALCRVYQLKRRLR